MASLTTQSTNTVNLQQSDFINGDECSGFFLFKIIVSKSQLDIRSTITLLLGKLMTGISYIMVSFGNNIANLNKDIRSIGNAIFACGEDPGNLLLQIFATYPDCSLDNGPFACCIDIMENQYKNGTLNLVSNDLTNKA